MSDSDRSPGPENESGSGGSNGTDILPPLRYDARLATEIELWWQDRWEAAGTFDTPNPAGPLADGFDRVPDLPKFYPLDFFPYPSGAGLHAVHPLVSLRPHDPPP